jgi:hypothetical protein
VVVNDDDIDDEQSDPGNTVNNKKQSTTICRFYHEYFQANRPELLYKIQRATKSSEPPSLGQMEDLKSQVETMKERMDSMEEMFDTKLAKMREALEQDYQRRIALVQASYKDMLSTLLRRNVGTPVLSQPSPSAELSSQQQQQLLAMASVAKNNFVGGPSLMQSSQLQGTYRPNNPFFNNTSLAGIQQYLQNTSPASSDLAALRMFGKL